MFNKRRGKVIKLREEVKSNWKQKDMSEGRNVCLKERTKRKKINVDEREKYMKS